jgi:adenine-specific DNA methylase
VQYAELMDFCYVWLRRLAPATPFFDVRQAKTTEDAVGSPNGSDVGLVEFTRRLSDVFCAAAAALKPGCAFIFTYHHNDLDAYAPLVVACLDAGLEPTRLYGCPSEMRASKHIHGRHAATVDTVFVLRKAPVPTALSGKFGTVAIGTVVAARVAALRRAGMRPTDADRACLRHSVLAAQAMSWLGGDWEPEDDVAERVACVLGVFGIDRALDVLGRPAAALG